MTLPEFRRKTGANTLYTEALGNPTTTEPAYTADELEFLKAMDTYKRRNNRPYPTWREVFRVFISLGYHKEETCRSK